MAYFGEILCVRRQISSEFFRLNIFFLLQVIPEEERPTRGQQQLFRAGQPPMYSTSYYPAQIGPAGYSTGGFLPVYASHSQPV